MSAGVVALLVGFALFKAALGGVVWWMALRAREAPGWPRGGGGPWADPPRPRSPGPRAERIRRGESRAKRRAHA